MTDRSNVPGELRIGIIGGTFDPIHIGHLIIAEEARCQLKLDRMVFIPAGIPPHKPDQPKAGPEERYQMTVLATEDNPAFEVSRFEIDRKCPSYTVDTLEEFKRIYGEKARLFFITGADTIFEILTWYHPERLIEMCKLVAATRPGYNLQEVTERLPKEFIDQTIETPEIGISSTELRNRVAEGNSIKYLVPQAVENYIYQNGLYGAKKQCSSRDQG